MVGSRNKKVQKNYSILSLAILSMVGIYTVVGNHVFAAEVYPTIKTTQTSDVMNSSNLREWLSSMVFKLIDFVKSSIPKNTNNSTLAFNSKISKTDTRLVEDQFSDISTHADRYYINYLSDKKIISTNGKKFNPENFMRLHELTKILVNSYRYKVWYNLNSNVWLSQDNYFTKLMPKYYNTAYEMWLLEWLNDIENFERFIFYDDLEKILQNFKGQYPELINLYYLDIDQSSNTIRRWELSRAVFKVFMLDNDESLAYQDIYYHENLDAIQKLAELEITNTLNNRFYPDNNITRWDFIVMLVKSYLKSQDAELTTSDVDFNIKDLDYNSSYAPFVLYAQENGMIDYLFEVVRSENYINLNNTLSKHEVYYIVSKVSGVEIDYDVLKADKELITRWELADLIVDSFNFNWSSKSNLSTNSQIEKLVMDIRSFADSPKIAWLIN